ncbi:retron St85 family RNA-directed DNA polymerase [Paracoccus luteus]|uniref:retron St85 family RNA-directed DNA polymerase n=1 Tax=Paracoccus luteus TaxID=2508543 RepID=UPI00106F3F38|nr:retron St85 family RNA-directed DNA polymerase [Paracoccus luteus]
MPDISLLRDIALDVGMSDASVLEIIQNAPKRYKVYRIPKKGSGFRIIAQPARELKTIQRSISKLVLEKLPVHASAAAYRPKIGIFHNAAVHAGTSPILKLDFERFFNSITAEAWRRFVASQEELRLSRSEMALVTRALFWGEGSKNPSCLSIGAPTSPLISNAIMFQFDVEMSNFAEERGLRYTRYADDIVASAKDFKVLHHFERHVRQYIKKNKTPSLTINESKRAIYSPGDRRLVTGLILTPDGKISLGRHRKREISSLIHFFRLGQLDHERLGYLQGLLSFSLSVEHDFVSRMSSKYGNDVVSAILNYRVPRRDGSPR